jgi:hypothetical protein
LLKELGRPLDKSMDKRLVKKLIRICCSTVIKSMSQ